MVTQIKNLKVTTRSARMNPERKKLLVDALRSGRYTQGKGALCVIDSQEKKYYCCLGVGAEISDISHSEVGDHGDPESYSISWDGQSGTWASTVTEWFGLDQSQDNPWFFQMYSRELVTWAEQYGSSRLGTRDLTIRATYVNDTLDLTFDQIADLFDFFF